MSLTSQLKRFILVLARNFCSMYILYNREYISAPPNEKFSSKRQPSPVNLSSRAIIHIIGLSLPSISSARENLKNNSQSTLSLVQTQLVYAYNRETRAPTRRCCGLCAVIDIKRRVGEGSEGWKRQGEGVLLSRLPLNACAPAQHRSIGRIRARTGLTCEERRREGIYDILQRVGFSGWSDGCLTVAWLVPLVQLFVCLARAR